MVVGLKRRIRIGRFVRVSMGNDFTARKLVGVPKYNTVEKHQGKDYQEALSNGLSYFRNSQQAEIV
jgi:hypothetical protein